jgi:hypothetical protein
MTRHLHYSTVADHPSIASNQTTTGWVSKTADVETAFLNTELTATQKIYVEQPEGFRRSAKNTWSASYQGTHGLKQVDTYGSKPQTYTVVFWA